VATAEYYLDREIEIKRALEIYYRSLIGGYASAYARTGREEFLRLSEVVRKERIRVILPYLAELARIREEFRRTGNLIWLTKTLYAFTIREARTIIGISGYIHRDFPERESFLLRLEWFRERIRYIVRKLWEQYPGTIFGVVVDKETRAPLVGAKIRINGYEITIQDAITGRYVFEGFPGRYTITVSMTNYVEETRTVLLPPAGRVEVNFELEKIVAKLFSYAFRISSDIVTVTGAVKKELKAIRETPIRIELFFDDFLSVIEDEIKFEDRFRPELEELMKAEVRRYKADIQAALFWGDFSVAEKIDFGIEEKSEVEIGDEEKKIMEEGKSSDEYTIAVFIFEDQVWYRRSTYEHALE
jgi:hypothetical protein